MKLTRIDAVFSRTTMVLFLCRNKSSRIGMKLCEEFLYNKREFLEPRTTGGGTWGGHNTSGCPTLPPLRACPGGLSPPGGPADSNPNTIKSHICREKSGRKNYRVSRDGAAPTSCSSSGGQIWIPFGAPERGILDLRHHQPFSISNSIMLPTGSE